MNEGRAGHDHDHSHGHVHDLLRLSRDYGVSAYLDICLADE